MHRWWARKPHNVVAEYITHYSKEGEIVIDPFCGSGVTLAEALRLKRKAIGVDLNPMAIFLTRITVQYAKLNDLQNAFNRIEFATRDQIEKLYETKCPKCKAMARTLATIWNRDKNTPIELRLECPQCDKKYRKPPDQSDLRKLQEIEAQQIPYWYPKDALKYNGQDFKEGTHLAGFSTVASLFTKRALTALSILYNAIERLDVPQDIRDFMKFTFTSRSHIASRMAPVAKPSPRSHWTEDSATSFWAQHRYWIPPIYMESNAWMLFESGFKGPQGLLRGKEESNQVIGKPTEANTFSDLTGSSYMVLNKSALSLEEVPDSSIDYCFTDPPYGGSIQYFELCTMWLAWLRGSNQDQRFNLDFTGEITINDQQQKNFDYYHKMLRASFEEIYRIMKAGKYLTVTFHNTDIKTYNSILKAVVLTGFDLEKVVYQPPARASAKMLLQPYGSAVGDYYIRFRKPESRGPTTSSEEMDKERYERIVVEAVKKIIASRGEPTPYSIIINSYPAIYDEVKKNGYLFSAPENIEVILKNRLNKDFRLVPVVEAGKVVGQKWWFKDPNTVPYIERVPLSERVEKAIINVLNRKVQATIDDILQEIFIRFPNSLTPHTESVRTILNEYAKPSKRRWILKPAIRLRESQHGRMLSLLSKVGRKYGFEIWIAPNERSTLEPEERKELVGSLSLQMTQDNLNRVKEIDVLWLSKNRVVAEFDVENTTGITEAIIRGANLKDGKLRRVIVIPKEREKLMHKKAKEPALQDLIADWRYMFYDDLEAFAKKKSTSIENFWKLSMVAGKGKSASQATLDAVIS